MLSGTMINGKPASLVNIIHLSIHFWPVLDRRAPQGNCFRTGVL